MKFIVTLLLALMLTSCVNKLTSIVRINYEGTVEEKIARKVVGAILHDTNTTQKEFTVKLVTEEWKKLCSSNQIAIPSNWCSVDYRVYGVYKDKSQSDWGVIESCNNIDVCQYKVLFESGFEE